MGNTRTRSPQKGSKVFVRPGEELRWLRDQFLPTAGKLYNALALAGAVPISQGRPRRKLMPSLQAVYWHEHEKLPMFRVGVMVETLGDPKATAKAIADVRKLPIERRRVERERLKKLGRRYVEQGQGALIEQLREAEWPPALTSKGSVTPADLRKHFQEMVIRAVAKWLANQARPHCDTENPAYNALVQVLDEMSVMSRITWFLQPD